MLLRTQQTSIKSVKQTTTDHDFRKKQTKNRPWSPKKQTSPGIIYCDHSSSDVINNWVKQRFNSVILDSENLTKIDKNQDGDGGNELVDNISKSYCAAGEILRNAKS